VLTLSGSSGSAFSTLVKAGGVGFGSATVPASGSSPFGTNPTGVILDGGKIARTSSAGAAWDRLFTLGSGGGTLEGSTGYVKFNSTGTVPFNSTGNTTLTFSGSQQDNEFHFKLVDPVGGKLSVNFIGPGRWIDTVASAQAWTYSGDTTISGGTLIANSSSNTLPFGPGKGNLVINAGTFDMSGRSFNINGLNGTSSGRLYQRNTTTVTLTLGNGDANGSYPGQILDVSGGTINLVKTGAGKQILSGSNSYAGSTSVNGGVLQFNSANSIGGSGSNVTVAAGAAAAAGYAIDQAFLNRINPASTGAVALAVNSSNALNLSNLPNVSFAAVGSISYGGVLTPPSSNLFRLGGVSGGTLVFSSSANAFNGANAGLWINPGSVIIKSFPNGGPLSILNGGLLRVTAKATANDPAGVSTFSSVGITGGATLDLTNNSMVVNYTGASPATTLRNMLFAHAIVSSTAGPTNALGYADNGTRVLVKYTYAGDANLDGQVDVTDLGALATNWQTAGLWTSGDFNYDGFIDVTDLGALATNWQAGVGSPLADTESFNQAMASVGLTPNVIPEPAAISAVALLGLVLTQQNRRRRGHRVD
jgi:fibronectin-binding autotransporter adhesin